MSSDRRTASESAASHSRGTSFGALLVGGLLGLVAAGQAWWRASGGGTSVSFSGNEASGGLTWALPAVLLAGTLLALVLRAAGRRVVAILLALDGLGMIATGVLRQRPTNQGVLDRLSQVTLADSFALSATAWPWIYAISGVVGTLGAVIMLLRARAWPVRTARFDPRSAVGTDMEVDPAGAWRAFDAGEDPTIDAPVADDPDVQSATTGDTMGTQGGSTGREPS